MQETNDDQPQHYALTAASSEVFGLCAGDELLLQCDRAIVLREVNAGREYPEVIYFPADVVEALSPVKTNRSSFCPIRGHASYWSFRGLENCIWSYPDPLPGVIQIKRHYAFDTSGELRISRIT